MKPPRILRPIAVSLGLLMLAALANAPRLYAGDKDKPPAPTSKPGGDGGPAPSAKGDEDTDSLDDDAADGLPPEVVSKAIERGVNWLKGRQGSDGSWGLIEGNNKYDPKDTGPEYKHPAGATALSLYALLKCGVPIEDSSVKKGFKYLKDKYRIPGGCYEVSAMLLAVTATADPFKRFKASVAAADRVKLVGEYRAWAQDLHDVLIKKRQGLGWRYNHGGGAEPGGNQDLSSTQLASLALFAAERCGIKTESKVWDDTITFALAQQEEDGPEVDRAVAGDKDKGKAPTRAGGAGDPPGRYAPAAPDKPVKDKARGFAYIKSESLPPDEGQATGGMTACGLGTILFGRHILFNRTGDKTWEKRDQKAIQQAIYDGLAWLDVNFNAGGANPKKKEINTYPLYYLYCVERAMDLVGVWKLGKHMWYIEMGQYLLGHQKQQGFWDAAAHKPSDVLNTCFALLFLKRATKGGIPFPSLTPSADEGGVDNRGKSEDPEDK